MKTQEMIDQEYDEQLIKNKLLTFVHSLPDLKIDTTKILIPQRCGYEKIYYQTLPIKNKLKPIPTKKSEIIFFDKMYENDSNFRIIIIYKFNKEFYLRIFDQLSERSMTKINEDTVNIYYKKLNTLF